MFAFEQAEVAGMDDLLDDVEVDASADRAGSSLRHTVIVLHRVPHHPTVGIDAPSVDDGDAFVPVGCRSGIGPDAGSGLYARESRRS